MALNNKPIPIAIQAANIKHLYPDAIINTIHDSLLTCLYKIKPSPLGETYKIKLEYKITESPKVYVVSPKHLLIAQGKTKLPHCYDQKKQQLCLYLPNNNEWNETKLLVQTIIPWAYDWLFHYEIWLGTGEWTGGGVHPLNNVNKILDK